MSTYGENPPVFGVGAALLGGGECGEGVTGSGRLGFAGSSDEQPASREAAVTAVTAARTVGFRLRLRREACASAGCVIIGLPPTVGGGQCCSDLEYGGGTGGRLRLPRPGSGVFGRCVREGRTRRSSPHSTRDISTSAGKVGPFVMAAIVPSGVDTPDGGCGPGGLPYGAAHIMRGNSCSGSSDSLSGTGSGPGHRIYEPGAPRAH
ncbi:hypothetical protein Sgleb_01010 [Streptomyces glebosus]|uniref:Uncharacterized protein n=1 Tax=Streptomyces glebosus TaxID=249580 RepID=A0A640SMF4_9ACTN|nr:hypothetical protein Sgleb_01010 [Streptomyces glebosus]GHG74129.1 hypothetical protein GCM10010513_47840 [Streptomyces glebosus]